jgi:hypothetical protein
MNEISNMPRDNIPPLGKVVEFHEPDKFALLCSSTRVIHSTEIEKCRRPAGHISTHQDPVRMHSDHAHFIFDEGIDFGSGQSDRQGSAKIKPVIGCF